MNPLIKVLEAAPAQPTAGDIAVMIIMLLFSALIGYFLGSINTAVIYSHLRYKKDIRDFGSGNAGMTNMLRTFGKKAAIITLAGDLLKTVVAVLFAQVVAFLLGFLAPNLASAEYLNFSAYCAALFAVTGHCYPIYYKMRGGKGVASAAAAIATLSPVTFLICFLVFALIVWGTKYVSLASVVTVMIYPVVLNRVDGPGISNIFAMLIAALVVFRHKENIKRLWNGNENKISFGSKKEKKDGKGNSEK